MAGPGPEARAAETTDLGIVRLTIARELETISQYERDAAAATDARVRHLLLHLAEEEKEHVAEGMALLGLLDARQADLNARGAHFLEDGHGSEAAPAPSDTIPADRPAQRAVEGLPTRVRRKMAEAMVPRTAPAAHAPAGHAPAADAPAADAPEGEPAAKKASTQDGAPRPGSDLAFDGPRASSRDDNAHPSAPAVFPPDNTFTVGSLRRPGQRQSPSPETFGIRHRTS